MKWKGPEHQRLRLVVSLLCGVLSLMAAATAFHMQSPVARFATVVFGLMWLAQAYSISADLQTSR
jgi:predicted membrane channel-forming protein YqfA (hemolysin III family)